MEENIIALLNNFKDDLDTSNLKFSYFFISRFIASLVTKPFLILTGLSGSGKTKLAQAFVKWISKDDSQYCLIPVGSDWTNREPLLGYPNALEPGKYVKPDNGVVDLLINAEKNLNLPYFLILDEMNLSHVERYFADFLSAMESDEKIFLHPKGDKWEKEVPARMIIPENLFIIGTVNIDETTYMFSPKVLDRAQVIEFRVTKNNIENFIKKPLKPKMKNLRFKGSNFSQNFMKYVNNKNEEFSNNKYQEDIMKFFTELQKFGAEFGYRTTSEMFHLIDNLKIFTNNQKFQITDDDIIDVAIIQKILPKLHGSRKKLKPLLDSLAELCLKEEARQEINNEESLKTRDEMLNNEENFRFKLSMEKLKRMKKRLIQEGFTSFAEA